MIIRLTAEGFELDNELNKYAHLKLNRLERYIPRAHRATALIEVSLEETRRRAVERTCRLMVRLPREELRVSETTQHMYSSLDVATADMTEQLRLLKRRSGSRLKRLTKRPRS